MLIALAFIAIYFVWGTTYLAALWGLEGMEPFVLSSLRYLLAGILLLIWCLMRRYSWPELSILKVAAIAGIVMLVGGSGLMVVAEKYISSGHAAVVIATEPLFFLLFDRKRWKEYFSNPFVISGLIIGFLGIALFSYFTPEQKDIGYQGVIGTLITLGGSILWVVGALYYERSSEVKKHPHILMSSIQLLSAGIFSAILALALGEWNEFHIEEVTANAWFGLLFLVIMGSIIAYMSFMWLMKVQPPAIVSTHTYVNPIVAVFVGWLLADERITWIQFFSLLIVLVGDC
jgi:drug/metabolite transporter (DMT)-like permease